MAARGEYLPTISTRSLAKTLHAHALDRGARRRASAAIDLEGTALQAALLVACGVAALLAAFVGRSNMSRWLFCWRQKPTTNRPPLTLSAIEPKVSTTTQQQQRQQPAPQPQPAVTYEDDDDDNVDDDLDEEAEEAAIREEERLTALAVAKAENQAKHAVLPPRPVLESRLSASMDNPGAYVTDQGLVLGECSNRMQMTASEGAGVPQLDMSKTSGGMNYGCQVSSQAKGELANAAVAELSRRKSSGAQLPPEDLERSEPGQSLAQSSEDTSDQVLTVREAAAAAPLSAEEQAAADAAFAAFLAEAEAEEAAEPGD